MQVPYYLKLFENIRKFIYINLNDIIFYYKKQKYPIQETIFTDASKREVEGQTRVGAAFYYSKEKSYKMYRLNKNTTISEAEAFAIYKAILFFITNISLPAIYIILSRKNFLNNAISF